MNHFAYFAPQTPSETLNLVSRLGNKAKILAGGTDLLIMMKEKLLKPEYLIDINEVRELKGISYEPGNGAVIGAGAKISEIEFSGIIREKYYALHQAAGELGSAQVRHMATIGGNSCHASPAAETPPPLIALGAKVLISNVFGDRELPLEEFILGNRVTALAEGEMLTKFILPEPASKSASRYAYIGRRDAMEIDAVNMAVNIVLEDDARTVKTLKLVMGSVSPKPLVSTEVPAILTGREFNSELVEKAARAASGEAKPISDIRASAEYRRELVAVLTRRLLQEVFGAVSGKGV
ncbi:MAG: xanthine dehydrogenase family protein subunit M [Desulfotomaculaceae bacterium]|nr:xanthine dehydrogenase family protein subunit M [Desulfotomaculaceae bacterium]